MRYIRNGAERGPKTISNSLPKIGRPNVAKMTKKTTQNDFKNAPEINKKTFWVPFFSMQKKVDYPKLFFLFFYSLQEALDPENPNKTHETYAKAKVPCFHQKPNFEKEMYKK